MRPLLATLNEAGGGSNLGTGELIYMEAVVIMACLDRPSVTPYGCSESARVAEGYRSIR